MIHCITKGNCRWSAYPTEDTISNPKRFSVFSVAFQHRIPKCISLILISCCGQTKVREYFSVLLRSKVVFVRFSDSDSMRFKLSESFTLQFSISLCYVPGGFNSLFSSWFTLFYVWALNAAITKVWQRSELTGSYSFLSSPLHSHLSHYYFHTSSLPASLCSPFLSSVLFVSLSICLSPSLCPVFCPHPFLMSSLLCLLPLYASCSVSSSIHLLLSDCSSQAIYQVWHPFTFQPLSFQHHFLHQNPRDWKAKEEEKRELERENERLGWGEKKTLISKALNLVFAAWTGEMKVYV